MTTKSAHETRLERVARAIGEAMAAGKPATEIARTALYVAGHDPDEVCTCESRGPAWKGACEYRMLADAVDEAFNPPDADEAEVSIHITAVERAARYVQSQPCACTPQAMEDQMPCPRCSALGRLNDEVQPR